MSPEQAEIVRSFRHKWADNGNGLPYTEWLESQLADRVIRSRAERATQEEHLRVLAGLREQLLQNTARMLPLAVVPQTEGDDPDD